MSWMYAGQDPYKLDDLKANILSEKLTLEKLNAKKDMLNYYFLQYGNKEVRAKAAKWMMIKFSDKPNDIAGSFLVVGKGVDPTKKSALLSAVQSKKITKDTANYNVGRLRDMHGTFNRLADLKILN